jgi:hypothetical protein
LGLGIGAAQAAKFHSIPIGQMTKQSQIRLQALVLGIGPPCLTSSTRSNLAISRAVLNVPCASRSESRSISLSCKADILAPPGFVSLHRWLCHLLGQVKVRKRANLPSSMRTGAEAPVCYRYRLSLLSCVAMPDGDAIQPSRARRPAFASRCREASRNGRRCPSRHRPSGRGEASRLNIFERSSSYRSLCVL